MCQCAKSGRCCQARWLVTVRGLECRRPSVNRCERYFTVVRVLDGSTFACAYYAKTSSAFVFTEPEGIDSRRRRASERP